MGNRAGAATRDALVTAARETLVEDGFARTSARSVASRAGCSQASLFYHFDGVAELLLAVLDEVSDRRMAAYREPLLAARTPGQLARLGRRIAAEDVRSGDLRVLVELVAGASARPDLTAGVAERIGRWEELVAQVAERFIPRPLRSTVRPAVVAHAVVAGFLGLELLRDLRGDGAGTEDVLTDLEKVGRLAGAGS
ncbi:TetR/AcrR family transcriptional regulator [Ornithinimicrobium tianjinense]|uniref:TetR/AcrR family transcriptional regulator n=1 Tax=Ornithinimicrobium tianjinense TaxID=1195761 RepID=UPI00166D6B2D|nr:TetR/AcrR family transcriptional regulator [Ornithinimicrobium tianjinense]